MLQCTSPTNHQFLFHVICHEVTHIAARILCCCSVGSFHSSFPAVFLVPMIKSVASISFYLRLHMVRMVAGCLILFKAVKACSDKAFSQTQVFRDARCAYPHQLCEGCKRDCAPEG